MKKTSYFYYHYSSLNCLTNVIWAVPARRWKECTHADQSPGYKVRFCGSWPKSTSTFLCSFSVFLFNGFSKLLACCTHIETLLESSFLSCQDNVKNACVRGGLGFYHQCLQKIYILKILPKQLWVQHSKKKYLLYWIGERQCGKSRHGGFQILWRSYITITFISALAPLFGRCW